jgi:predicted TPR repeat methyltransferase
MVMREDRSMNDDRLAWIYSATTPAELRERYEEWADEYDADLGALSWEAPLAAARRCAALLPIGGVVLDAGCGTGLVGVGLRAEGVASVVGFDLSPAMIGRARATGAYAELHQGSLLEPLPFAPGRFNAVISVGVFTCGHVGPEAFAGLARAVAPGGHVTLTFRLDAIDELGYAAEAERLERVGTWTLVDRPDPMPLLVEDGIPVDMLVLSWQVHEH